MGTLQDQDDFDYSISDGRSLPVSALLFVLEIDIFVTVEHRCQVHHPLDLLVHHNLSTVHHVMVAQAAAAPGRESKEETVFKLVKHIMCTSKEIEYQKK